MDEKAILECGISYLQSRTQDFAPITASADFSALTCPKYSDNKPEYVEEIGREELGMAA